MDAIVAKYRHDPPAQLLGLLALGQREVEKHNVGSPAVVRCMRTLIHPRNRGATLLDIPEVAQKVADISGVAFAEHEALQAAAVRLPVVGTKERLAVEIANEQSGCMIRLISDLLRCSPRLLTLNGVITSYKQIL